MIKVDGKVVSLIEKIRNFVDTGSITARDFPLGGVCDMIENTLGVSFWECIGDIGDHGYEKLAALYQEGLADAVDRGDMSDCSRLLELYMHTYQTLYTILNEDERTLRKKPYFKMIMDLGSAYAQVQCRRNREKSAQMAMKEDWALASGYGAVYTYLEAGETLYQPEDIRSQQEYICFTADKEKDGIKDGVWQYRAAEPMEGLNDKQIKSYYRICPHRVLEEYDYSIWVEPSMAVVGDVSRFCKVYGEKNSFLSFPRSEEDCIYQDMAATQMGSDDDNICVRKKILQFQKEGYPEHNGLIDHRIMARQHGDMRLQRVMDQWWEETQVNWGLEKNLFNYVAWKNSFLFSVCDLFIYSNLYFINKEIDLDLREEY